MRNKVIVIIEARLNSRRLPGKVLLKVRNKPLIEHMIDRLKYVKGIDKIVVATTKKKADQRLINFLKKKKIFFFRGSENNVLKRNVDAAKKYNSDIIINLTGDCPLIDPKIIQECLKIFKKDRYDLVSNSLIRSYPDGMDVNIFTLKSIIRCQKMSKSKDEKEHTTLIFKKNRKFFKIRDLLAPKKLRWPNLGLTLDEKEDYLLIKKIFKYFLINKKVFTCSEIIKLLKYEKKNWLKINKDVKRTIIA
tara:strand:- start:530 stop:1273 length:744 start_codon:yes stop_codon:yes gene_type:complete